ncbi:MAG: hypothetical protein LBR49_04780, partial [Tannerella sp.]|nr:hypothetical protein [Tannerella sp.]
SSYFRFPTSIQDLHLLDMNHAENNLTSFLSTNTTVATTNGERIFSASFSCDYGVRTYTENVELKCKDGYYKRDAGTPNNNYDDECLRVSRRVSKEFPSSCPAQYSTANLGCTVSCGGGQYKISCTDGHYSDSRTVYCDAVKRDGTKISGVDISVCRDATSYAGNEPDRNYSCTARCPSSSWTEGSCNTQSCCPSAVSCTYGCASYCEGNCVSCNNPPSSSSS